MTAYRVQDGSLDLLLSYGAHVENRTGQKLFRFQSWHTLVCMIRTFDTPLAVLAAKVNKDMSGSCYH